MLHLGVRDFFAVFAIFIRSRYLAYSRRSERRLKNFFSFLSPYFSPTFSHAVSSHCSQINWKHNTWKRLPLVEIQHSHALIRYSITITSCPSVSRNSRWVPQAILFSKLLSSELQYLKSFMRNSIVSFKEMFEIIAWHQQDFTISPAK